MKNKRAGILRFLAIMTGAMLLPFCSACVNDAPVETKPLTIYTTSASDTGEETSKNESLDASSAEETEKNTDRTSTEDRTDIDVTEPDTDEEKTTEEAVANVPKYVFLFVGDGMGYSHIQGASYYKAAINGVGDGEEFSGAALNFMKFPVMGNVINYNSDTYITDSASAITAITSGEKTVSDRINIAPDGERLYETIAERLKKQKNFQIGVVSNANINHATPAGFYAHQLDRRMYYEIGQELLVSDFNYFGGGQLRSPQGSDGTWPDLYDMAAANGYQIFRSDQALGELNAGMDHVLISSEQKAEGEGMYLAIDAPAGSATLADYVRGGIQVMGDADSFFFGIESGLSDWAAHENDAASLLKEIFVLEDAVAEALKFYEQHPEDTLILVTADHETGGFSLGTSNQGYQLYPQGLQNQKISYWKYLVTYVNRYRAEQTSWESVLWEMRSLFGLTVDGTFQQEDDEKLKLTKEEEILLLQAYNMSMAGQYAEFGTSAYEVYGDCDPLAHTVVTLLGKKCGYDFTTVYHTAETIPIYAIGAGAEKFGGVLDNTEISKRLAELLSVE